MPIFVEAITAMAVVIPEIVFLEVVFQDLFVMYGQVPRGVLIIHSLVR